MILRVMSVIDDKTVIYGHTRTYTLLDEFSRACYTNPNLNLPIHLSEPRTGGPSLRGLSV